MGSNRRWLAAWVLLAFFGLGNVGCEGVLDIPDVSLKSTGDTATSESTSGSQGGGGSGGSGGSGSGGIGAQGGAAGALSFKAYASYPTTLKETTAVAVVDCDGDGAGELVVAAREPSNGGLALMQNNGSGSFHTNPSVKEAAAREPTSLAVAQLDGQAGLDVAMGLGGASDPETGFAAMFANDSSCGFDDPIQLATEGRPVTDLAVLDIDGDKTPDLAGTISKMKLDWLMFYNGKNKLSSTMDMVDNVNPRAIGVGLINKDDSPDVAYVAANTGHRKVFVHFNAGAVIEKDFVMLPLDGELAEPVDLSLGDLDGDGYTDLLALDGSANAIVGFINDKGVGFTQASYPVGASGPVALAMADMDGDKDSDVVTANNNGTVSLLLFQDGKLDLAPGFPRAIGANPSNIAVGHLNTDGRLDIVTCHVGGDISVILSD